jgi:hypothetical protein
MLERYHKMKKDELLALAAEAGVKGRSRMTKAQLIEALVNLAQAVEPVPEQVPASEPPPSPDLRPGPPAPERIPQLPLLLEENRLVLLPQGPKTAFAYWELVGDDVPGDLILKVISTSAGIEIASSEVAGRTGSFYIVLERPGQEIEATLGHGPDGVFQMLLKSNRIRLPDDSPSDDLPTVWMTRRKDYEEIYRLSMGRLGEGEPLLTHEEYRREYPVFSRQGERKKDRP